MSSLSIHEETLTVTAYLRYNLTRIQCAAVFYERPERFLWTDEAVLTVQGMCCTISQNSSILSSFQDPLSFQYYTLQRTLISVKLGMGPGTRLAKCSSEYIM